MKILLIQPPIKDFFTTPVRLYPLGLAYAARAIEKCGHQAEILDCLVGKKHQLALPIDFSYLKRFQQNSNFPFKYFYRFGITDSEIIKAVEDSRPDMIGISSNFTAYFESVYELVQLLKKHFQIPIFIGGNHANAFKNVIEQKYPLIDHVLTGTAEQALPLLFNVNTTIDWKSHFPAHELLNETYKAGKKRTVSLTAGRGCPFQCDFCSVHAMFGSVMDYRPVEHVIQEMLWCRSHKNTEVFNFEDDNLSFDKRWFKKLLTTISKTPELQDVEFTALNGMCYPTLDEETLDMMAAVGFYRLNFSLVTRDIHLRQAHKRPVALGKFERLVAYAQQLGFFVTVHLIFGLPGQTVDEIRESVDYLLDLGVLVGPSIFYLPPGAAIYKSLDIPNNIRENWNLYRSSAFAIETELISRTQLVDLFIETLEKNKKNKKPGGSS